jgi:hypothetical protein
MLIQKNSYGEDIIGTWSNKKYIQETILPTLQKKYLDNNYILDEDFYTTNEGEFRVYKDIELGADEDYEEFTIVSKQVLTDGYYPKSLNIEKYLIYRRDVKCY